MTGLRALGHPADRLDPVCCSLSGHGQSACSCGRSATVGGTGCVRHDPAGVITASAWFGPVMPGWLSTEGASSRLVRSRGVFWPESSGADLPGHGYDYRTTIAPWFRGPFTGSPDVHVAGRVRLRPGHLPGARHRRLGDLGGLAVQQARAHLELPAVVPVAALHRLAQPPPRPQSPAQAAGAGARSACPTNPGTAPLTGRGSGDRISDGWPAMPC